MMTGKQHIMQETPYGFCHCGCGQQTDLATRSRPEHGYVKGEPLKFIRGHIGKLNSRRIAASKIITHADGSVTQLCTRCKTHRQLSPISEFNRSQTRSTGWRAHCRDCEREQANAFYHRNPEPYKARARVHKKALRAELLERLERIRQQHGCKLCGERDTCALHFHHHLTKSRAMAHCTDSRSAFARELVKCAVLCGRCHLKVHAGKLSVSPEMLCKVDDGI